MFRDLYIHYKTLSPSLKYALYATAFFLLCIIIFLPIYLAKINELNAIQSRIKEVENNLLEGKALKARCNLPTDDEKKIWLEVRDDLFKRIPPEKRLLQLVKEIASVAEDCSIHDVSFSMPVSQENSIGTNRTVVNSPNASIERDMLSAKQENEMDDVKMDKFTIRTVFHCEYQELAHFLKKINNLARLLEIESLEIKRRLPLMEVEMAIHAFYSQGRDDA